MKRNAFGAIDLLLGLLILGVIAVFSMNTFQNTSSTLKPTGNTKNVRQYVDEQVNQIEDLKKQSEDIQKEMLKMNNY